MKQKDFYWLVGLLEGEGTFFILGNHRPVVCLSMTDRDVVDRVSQLWGRAVTEHAPRESTHKPYYTTRISGRAAAFLMEQLFLHMGTRRQAQIEKVLTEWEPRSSLKISDYQKIRDLSASKTHQEIADMFDVDRTYVTKIINGDYGQEAKTLACGARDIGSIPINHP